MTFTNWLRDLRGNAHSQRATGNGPQTVRKARARFRPQLEVLEVRLAPAILTVNTTADETDHTDSVLSLREAIAAANPGDTIQFTAGLSGAIDLSTSEGGQGTLTLTKSVRIDGTGATITIEGGNTNAAISPTNAQVFVVNSGITATLNDLTISNGYASDGGGIDNAGTLTVSNCIFAGNSADQGGASGTAGLQPSGTVPSTTTWPAVAAASGTMGVGT
jgi:CSLREA domain-containing protein